MRCFKQAGYEVACIEGPQGCIATIAAAARVIALAPEPHSESFLFNPEGIQNSTALGKNLYCCDGAPGGDRLWLAPERCYHWICEPRDDPQEGDHQVPPSVDPGDYLMSYENGRINFQAGISVHNHRTNVDTKAHVQRSVTQLKSPFDCKNICSASYRIDQHLSVDQGLAGLWNIAQIPRGSVILLPLKKSEMPRKYYSQADVRLTDNAFAMYIGGTASAKIGYGSETVFGHSGAFYWTDNILNFLYRENPVVEQGFYCDTLNDEDPKDQVFQAFDGFGFGELEYHSQAAGEQSPVGKSVEDTSVLHALRGPTTDVLQAASDLLRLSKSEIADLLAFN